MIPPAPPAAIGPVRLRALVGWAAGVSLLLPNAVVLGETMAFESSLPVRALQTSLRSD
jgi:hypothetical protein